MVYFVYFPDLVLNECMHVQYIKSCTDLEVWEGKTDFYFYFGCLPPPQVESWTFRSDGVQLTSSVARKFNFFVVKW